MTDDYENQTVGQYIRSRIPSLFQLPNTSLKTLNPIPAFRAMSRSDWNFFMMGYMAWTIDAFDFFCVSSAASAIATSLKVSITDITWGITLVLMFRSLGAVIFGFISDTYGRKPAYLMCAGLFVVIEIGTGFVKTYAQFLGVRAGEYIRFFCSMLIADLMLGDYIWMIFFPTLKP